MLFSIQLIRCRQFNLILILLVLRLFQSFLSTLLCDIYKWNIQSLFGFFLLFLLSRMESSCLIIFLYIVMFYKDHRKYYKGCYGKLKLDICFQSLGGQFYILRVLCGYNTDQSLQSYSQGGQSLPPKKSAWTLYENIIITPRTIALIKLDILFPY